MQNKLFEIKPNGKRPPRFDPSSDIIKLKSEDTELGLLKTILAYRAFRLSSNWSYFSEECDRLKIVFSRLSYPSCFVEYPPN